MRWKNDSLLRSYTRNTSHPSCVKLSKHLPLLTPFDNFMTPRFSFTRRFQSAASKRFLVTITTFPQTCSHFSQFLIRLARSLLDGSEIKLLAVSRKSITETRHHDTNRFKASCCSFLVGGSKAIGARQICLMHGCAGGIRGKFGGSPQVLLVGNPQALSLAIRPPD